MPGGIISIGNSAFGGSGLTSIVIPNPYVTIGVSCFNGSKSLVNVTLPEGMKTIPMECFKATGIKNINIPKSIVTIEDGAFSESALTSIDLLNCTSLTSIKTSAFSATPIISAKLPESLTELGSRAFESCFFLTEIKIPSKISVLNELTFSYCVSLVNVIFTPVKTSYGTDSYNIQEIGPRAFYGCNRLGGALGNVEFLASLNNLYSIGDEAFGFCGGIYSINLPANIVSIGKGAFRDCMNLGSMSIPSKVTVINENTFKNCSSLKTIIMSGIVKEIGNYAFENCTSFETISLPDSIMTIGIGAFKGNTNLKSIKLPANIEILSDSMFEDCKSIDTITLPNSITTIGNKTFKNCQSIPSILLPYKLKTIGTEAFFGCSLLNELNFRYAANLTTIGSKAFENCTGLKSVNIEYADNLTKISTYAFKNSGIQGFLRIPANVKTIENGVFENCSYITSVEFPDGLASIGKLSFKNCTSLVSATIPAATTIVYMGNDTSFDGCSMFTNAIIKAVPANISALENSETVLPVNCFREIRTVEIGDENIVNARITDEFTMNPKVVIKGVSSGTTTVKIVGTIMYETGKDPNTGAPLINKFDTMVQFNVSVTAIKCTGVSFDQPVRGIAINKTSGVLLNPVLTPSNTTDIMTWKSDNESIARVDSDGKVYPVNYGSTTIRLKVGSQPEVQCQVNVCAPASYLALDKYNAAIISGNNLTLKATAFYSSTYDSVKTLYPDIILWSSSNPDVATVDAYGNVKAVKAGEAKITARADASGATKVCAVTVVPETTVVSFDKTNMTLQKSESGKITINLSPSDSPLSQIKITNSNNSVISHSISGNVITIVGRAGGTAKITATPVSGQAAECIINVNSPLASLTAKSPMTLNKGASRTIELVKSPLDATDKLIYISKNPSVATVDAAGKVTAVGAGTTTITIRNETGLVSATCEVIVNAPVTGVKLNTTSATIYKGDVLQLTATVMPSDATNKELVWSSSNTAVATVDSNGRVTGVGAGTASIKAKSANSYYYATCYLTVKAGTSGGTAVSNRLGGTDRFGTSVMVSKAGWATADNVVLVNAFGFADALTGVPFAYLKDAPILLTDVNEIPTATVNEILRLKAKTVYILGGTGVVSAKVENYLKSKNIQVVRIAGTDRFSTAIAIGNAVTSIKNNKTAVLTTAYNYPDALSMSPYAALNSYPVLYTEPTVLQAGTRDFIKAKGITKVLIAGGTGAVSLNVENTLKSMGITIERLAGPDRYSTSASIATKYSSSFDKDVMLATGDNFPDALAGGVLAAKKRVPILLVDNTGTNTAARTYIKSKNPSNIYILGGTGVVSNEVVNSFK